MPPEIPDTVRCPHCDARMIPASEGAGLWCQFCGVIVDDESARKTAVDLHNMQAQQPHAYDPPGATWNMDPDLCRALDDAWHDIQRGDLTLARWTLQRAQSRFADSADLWYLFALTAEAPREKSMHLDRALALQPYHEYAWHERGVLDGVIPPGDAPGDADAVADAADGEVAGASDTQECPLCGGFIAYSAAAGAVVCGHCGHTLGAAVAAASARPAMTGYRDLEHALLQRRYGFSRQWDIGARVLTCQNCAAQLTLTSELAALCPFCDSAHVLVEDAVGSFEEPDALIPFKLDRTRAARAVHARMPADLRAQVVRGEMWGVYLPFWAFAGMVSIMPLPGTGFAGISVQPGVYNVENALVGGVERPAQRALYELMPYQLRDLMPYDRRILARWSAQVYRVDVVQASLTARAYLKYVARGLASGYMQDAPEGDLARTDSTAYSPPNTPAWRAMHVDVIATRYRLVLLPVWMVTLILRDGAHRPAMVNGQTGEAILSASFAHDANITGPQRPPVEPLPQITPLPRRRSNVIRPITPPPDRRR